MPLPARRVAFHDVLYDGTDGYTRQEDVRDEAAPDLGMRLTVRDSAVVVDRMPGHAAYPRDSGKTRLFILEPGQTGRYRANFRFTRTQCPCNPSWYYEDWLVHIAHGASEPDRFVRAAPDHDADHRVNLYGGRAIAHR